MPQEEAAKVSGVCRACSWVGIHRGVQTCSKRRVVYNGYGSHPYHAPVCKYDPLLEDTFSPNTATVAGGIVDNMRSFDKRITDLLEEAMRYRDRIAMLEARLVAMKLGEEDGDEYEA